MPHRRSAARALVALAPFALAPGLARAQDPVVKPTTTTAITTRLPLPTGLSARQQPDGRIVVRWSAIPGAVKYQVVRSVPPAAAVMLPAVTDTTYVDSDVVAGKSYYYQIAGIDAAGGLGLKASTYTASTLSVSTGGTTTTATTPAAPAPIVERQYADGVVAVEWASTGNARSYTVTRLEYASASADPTTMDASTRRTARTWTVDGSERRQVVDTVTAGATARWVQYRVATTTFLNTAGSSATSTPRLVPAASTTTTSTAPTTASLAITAVAPSLELSVAVGASLSLAERTAATGAQWLSMHPQIATVTADGTVTGRSGGTASVVLVIPQSDGSIRVSVIRLRVTP